MSARDHEFVQALGVSKSRIAAAIGKTRQAVNRGLRERQGNADDYFKAADFVRMLEFWQTDPTLRGLVKEAVASLYPELFETVGRVVEAAGAREFDVTIEAAYWFYTADLASMRSDSPGCADQLTQICRHPRAHVKVIVQGYDRDTAVQNYQGPEFPHSMVFKCKSAEVLDHSLTTVLRIEATGQMQLFVVGDTGFTPVGRSEAARIRRSLSRLLEHDTEPQGASEEEAVQGAQVEVPGDVDVAKERTPVAA